MSSVVNTHFSLLHESGTVQNGVGMAVFQENFI